MLWEYLTIFSYIFRVPRISSSTTIWLISTWRKEIGENFMHITVVSQKMVVKSTPTSFDRTKYQQNINKMVSIELSPKRHNCFDVVNPQDTAPRRRLRVGGPGCSIWVELMDLSVWNPKKVLLGTQIPRVQGDESRTWRLSRSLGWGWS